MNKHSYLSTWLVSWSKEHEMDSFILVNEAREAEFQMSKLDFINPSNKAEIRSLQPPHLNLCLSAHPFYTYCTAQTWEFLFLIGYACLACHQ